MRNPIQPTPDRPIPLPDCILMDAWWTGTLRDRPERLRPVTGARQEGPHDRHLPNDRRPG